MLDTLNRQNVTATGGGCRDLAAIGFSTETRNHYLRMAEHTTRWLRPRSRAH